MFVFVFVRVCVYMGVVLGVSFQQREEGGTVAIDWQAEAFNVRRAHVLEFFGMNEHET